MTKKNKANANKQSKQRKARTAVHTANRQARRRDPYYDCSCPPIDALDATHPGLPPLPRSVGPYIPETLTYITSGMNYTTSLWGPIKFKAAQGDYWRSSVGIAGIAGGSAINAANNARIIAPIDMSAYAKASMVPASVTVQVMNPAALQTTAGNVYVVRCNQLIKLAGSSTLWDNLANQIVSRSNSLPMSAAGLNQRPVKIDCVPLDMTSYSQFERLSNNSTGTFTFDSDDHSFDTMSPVLIYNPDAVALTVAVTIKWRMRLDPGIPGYGAGLPQKAAPPGYWDRALAYAQSFGNAARAAVTSDEAMALTTRMGSLAISNYSARLAVPPRFRGAYITEL